MAGKSYEGVVKREGVFREGSRALDITAPNIYLASEAAKQTVVKQTAGDEITSDGRIKV